MRIFVTVLMVLSLACAAAGAPADKESAPPTVKPKKISIDTNYDGKVDRTEYYDASGEITRVESDQNGDGVIDEWIIFEKGKPVRKEKDTNGDGKADVWVDY